LRIVKQNESIFIDFKSRLLLVIIFILIVSLENNPLVQLEAILGLSPAPIERFFNIKSLFSGMTEAFHQLVKLEYKKAIDSNIISPLFVIFIIVFLINGRIPVLITKKREIAFFLFVVLLSIVVNIFN